MFNPALLSKDTRNIPSKNKIGRNGKSGYSLC